MRIIPVRIEFFKGVKSSFRMKDAKRYKMFIYPEMYDIFNYV